MMNNSAFDNFSEEAIEALDFARCMRRDGSTYGTGGQCRKGSPTGPKEKEAKSGKSGGGGGKAETVASSRGAAGDKAREAARAKEKARSDKAAASRKAKKDAEPLRKEIKAKEKELKARDKELNARAKKLKEMRDVQKSGPKNPELNARVKAYAKDLRQRESSFKKDLRELNRMASQYDKAVSGKSGGWFGRGL